LGPEVDDVEAGHPHAGIIDLALALPATDLQLTALH